MFLVISSRFPINFERRRNYWHSALISAEAAVVAKQGSLASCCDSYIATIPFPVLVFC